MSSPLNVVLLNMGKASDSSAKNPERTETVRLILEDERPDIVFGQEILSPKQPKWLPDGLSYDWRVTGSETAIVWNSELFQDVKEIDQGMKEKIRVKMTATGKSWASDAATLGSVPARITIVGLVHKSSKTRVLAVSWHGPHKITTAKKKTTFKALQDFCIEVRDQLFKSTETRIVIGGDFNLCLDEVKPETKFVVESYKPSPRRKDKEVIDYFVHTKDVKMKDTAPIVNVRGPVAAPEKPGSSIVKKDKEGEKDPSPDRPDKAGTSSAQASMSHDPVNASTSKEKGISSSKQTAKPSTKKITSGVLGGPSDHSRSFSTSASQTELCLDHDPLKAKLIINP